MKEVFHSNDHQFICLKSTIHSNEHNLICNIGVHISLINNSYRVFKTMIETFIYETLLDSCMNYSWYDIHLLVVYDQWSYAKPSWMNLAIIELWSLIREAFSSSYQRKTDQVTDHFWWGRGREFPSQLFLCIFTLKSYHLFICWMVFHAVGVNISCKAYSKLN